MEHEVGICKTCGKNLLENFGDLSRRTDKNLCMAGSLMSRAVERANESIPEYCPRCLKENRKNKINKVINFFRK